MNEERKENNIVLGLITTETRSEMAKNTRTGPNTTQLILYPLSPGIEMIRSLTCNPSGMISKFCTLSHTKYTTFLEYIIKYKQKTMITIIGKMII